MKKLKWVKYAAYGSLDDEEHLEVLSTKEFCTGLTLGVWKSGDEFRAGNVGGNLWGTARTKAAAKRLAISTCRQLCSAAIEALHQFPTARIGAAK